VSVKATYPGATTFPGRGTAFGLTPDGPDPLTLVPDDLTPRGLSAAAFGSFGVATIVFAPSVLPGPKTFPGPTYPGRGSGLGSSPSQIPALAVTPV
jgi:hypothetical protein